METQFSAWLLSTQLSFLRCFHEWRAHRGELAAQWRQMLSLQLANIISEDRPPYHPWKLYTSHSCSESKRMKKDPYDGRWNTHDIPSLLFQDLGKGQTCAKNMFRFICAKDLFRRILPKGCTRQTLAQRNARTCSQKQSRHLTVWQTAQPALQRLKA